MDLSCTNETWYLANGQQAPASMRSYVILSQRENNRGDTVSVAFSREGDPGAWIFDRIGAACGLLHGSINAERSDDMNLSYSMYGASLITSMDAVLRSIKAKTGGDLSLP